MQSSHLMPAAFLGHGNPMNTLSDNRYTRAWRRFGEACGSPTAVLMVSAHWYINATAVTAMPAPRTIHDFYGFPRGLSEFEYPAPGSPDLAHEVAELVGRDVMGLDAESWGLDHGTWSVLAHVFPNADVPVVQLSINALQPFEYHMDLARRLAPLRERGVVVMGSGNLVHNLHRLDWDAPDSGFDWAVRFDSLVREVMATGPGRVAELANDADYPLTAPTPDHFIPLLYLGALAHEAGRPTQMLVEGMAYGSVSMTAFTLDMRAEKPAAHDDTSALVASADTTAPPEPPATRAEHANM